MKKVFSAFIIAFLFAASVFAERPWNYRVFDVYVDANALVSNNLFGVNDIARETIVIDLTAIADDMKRTGKDFNETISVDASAGFMLDIPKGLVFGADAGLQLYESLSIGKELFYFLGYGNTVNEDLNISTEGYADIFAYAKADLGWNCGNLKLVFSPSVFTAVAHVTSEGSSAVFKNTNDGKFAYELTGNFNMYTPVDVGVDLYNQVMAGNYMALLDTGKEILLNLKDSVGVDVQAGFEYELNPELSINGYVRIPVIPSTMHHKETFTVKSEWETTVMDIAQGNLGSPSFDMTFVGGEAADYSINRPLKLNIGGDFHAWNNIMSYYGNLGVCLEHPFASDFSETGIYVDYLFGLRVGILNVLNFTLSTERTDKVFSQKISAGLNVRLVEVTAGVSSSSSDFAKSFTGAGAKAFVEVHAGL